MAAGTQVGSFHPLVAFADLERAVAALHGATIAIEGDDQLLELLARMAEAVGATPVRLAPGAEARLPRGGGPRRRRLRRPPRRDRRARPASPASTRPGSLAIYGPLIEQTLGNARALGIAAALTGPMTRGDRGTVAAPPRRPARPRAGRRGPVSGPRRARDRDRRASGAP